MANEFDNASFTGAKSDLLNSMSPPVTRDEAVRVAQRHFGISGSASELASERDANFRVVTEQGDMYVLKFSNPAEPAQHTNFQTEALLYLQQRDPQLPIPKMVTALNDEYELTLPLQDGRQSVVRMLTWVKGEQVKYVTITRALRRDIGGTLARLGSALRDFDHPASNLDILWDIKNAARLRGMTRAINEPALCKQVSAELSNFAIKIMPRLARLREQVIHNDLNHDNIVVSPQHPDRVGGILDFGDMVKTPLAIEVAVAASYFTSLDGDPLNHVTDVVTGYHSVTPLSREELELMRDLIVARLVTLITITSWRAERYPENAAYILRNNAPAQYGLKRFAVLPREEVTTRLLHSCDVE